MVDALAHKRRRIRRQQGTALTAYSRDNTSHGAKLPVTPHDLVAFPESLPAPLRAPRERYGLGDALTGAIQFFSPRSKQYNGQETTRRRTEKSRLCATGSVHRGLGSPKIGFNGA